MNINVTILTPKEVIFEGKVNSVIMPGEGGIFEVLAFHKRLLGRLVSGTIILDGKGLPIRRGIVKVDQNRVTIIIEEPT